LPVEIFKALQAARMFLDLLIFVLTIRSIFIGVVFLSRGQPHPILAGIISGLDKVIGPFYAPFRQVTPRIEHLDISPLVAIVILGLFRSALPEYVG
jgi:uncharacterized protein YggT (Ycf19 family)